MNNTKKRRVTYKELVEMGNISWCWRTVKRKITTENFPAYKESRFFYFDPDEVEAWFKKRKVSK